MSLERTQLALLAAIAATCLVSIFAAQVLLALAVAVFLARLYLGTAQLARLPVDGPILAFCVWSLLSASFSQNPVVSHDSAKKLILFALLYLAVDGLARGGERERVLDAATLGGIVLAAGALAQFYFQGFDTLDNRPRSFLGHYMTASGLCMGILGGPQVDKVAEQAFFQQLRMQRGDAVNRELPTMASDAMRTCRTPPSSMIDMRRRRSMSPGHFTATSRRKCALIS